MSDDIFISYANEDGARVERLARLLEAEGYTVWWDREIPVGRTFDEVIEETLDAAQCVIVVWTAHSVGSRWVKTEAGEGAARGILVPVLLDAVRIPLAFRRIQAANLVGWEGDPQHPGVVQLLEAVSRYVGLPTEEAPAHAAEDETPPTGPLEPPPGADRDERATEEEAAVAEVEATEHAEDLEAELDGPSSEEGTASAGKQRPAGLERWVKEPKRLALVVGGAILIVVTLFVVLQKDDPSGSVAPRVASIEISPSRARIAVDSTVHLTATLRDTLANPLDGSVVWESSDPSIASVDTAGVVTGVAADATLITARSKGVEASIIVTVLESDAGGVETPPDPGGGDTAASVAAITIAPAQLSLEVGGARERLTATLKDANGNTLSGEAVTWTSSDPSVASVSPTGVVAGLGEGTATITASRAAVQGAAGVRVSAAPGTQTEARIPAFDFVLIRAGSFQMGSTDGETDEQPVHTVRLTHAFYLSATEVTQGQWKAVMRSNPSRFTGDDDLPVDNVSWDDVQAFVGRLNALENCRRCYRLPTEAEWEYAARAGTTGAYAGDRVAMGWYSENAGGRTHPVGQKQRNLWGLYDMHGNVQEWVSDWYGRYPSGTVTDPPGPETGLGRVLRGGGWYHPARDARSAARDRDASDRRDSDFGFRLVKEAQ